MEAMNKNKKGIFILLYLLGIVLAVLVGAGGLLLIFHFYPDFASNTVTNITKTEKEVTVTDTGIADAVEKVYDSVVVIETFSKGKAYATGTGFIYKENSGLYYILTNYHVIEGGDNVKVVFTDGDEVDVSIVGGDPYADIAVLSYKSDKDLSVSEIGSSETMRVGDTVFAIGAPLDSTVYSWSVTRGILSGKDREVAVKVNNTISSDWIMHVLQTDAAINSGNSGGPLCNSNGQVIGVTNMKLVNSGVEGMGFAIPIEDAVDYADALINGEDVSRPYLGIKMYDVSNSYYAYYYGSNTNAKSGVGISEVVSGSPADKAGLKAGDVIIGFGGVDIADVATLRFNLYKYKNGDSVEVKYMRGDKVNTTTVLLEKSS